MIDPLTTVLILFFGSVFIFSFVRQWRKLRRFTRQKILAETLQRDGPEAAKAMEAHLKGEWR